MNDRECKTQSDVDAAIHAGDRVILRDSTSAILYGSVSAVLCDSSAASLCGFTTADLRDSASGDLYGSARAVLRGSAAAVLFDSATAVLYDSARAIEGLTRRALRQSRPVVLLGPIGSRNKMLSVYQCADGGILVRAGCFLGSRDEFAAAVAKTHPTGQYAEEYRAALAMIDALAAANAVQREAA